ncbi:MAG: tetratricopeptide repeat protein [Candidatus Atribacteria bacterium]
MNIIIKKNYNKISKISFLLIILLPTLFVYKYVYNFRINQAVVMNLLILAICTFYILNTINEGKFIYSTHSLNFPILLFIIIAIISVLITNSFWSSLRGFVNILSYFLIYFIVINNIKNKDSFNFCLIIFFITASLTSLYLIIQYYEIDPFLSDIQRLTSTLGNRNYVASYLALIFPIAFSFFLLESKKRNKIFYEVTLLIIYTGIIICHTRAIWIALIFSLLLFGYLLSHFKINKILRDNKKWLVILFLLFLLITLIYSTDNPLNRSSITAAERAISAFDMQGSSLRTRLLIWQSTIDMIKDRPLFGSGLGTFPLHYLDYQANFLQRNPDYLNFWGKAGEAHNEYLQILAEMGIIGLLFFLLIIIIFYKTNLNLIKKIGTINGKIIIVGLISGVTVTLIHGILSFPFHIPAVGAAFWFIIGITTVSADIFYEKSKDKKITDCKKISFYSTKNKKYYKLIKITLIILILILMTIVMNIFVIKPYRAELHLYQGRRWLIDEDYKNALPVISYAQELNPHNGRILHALGATYYNLNKYNQAIYYLQEAKKYIIDVNTFYILGLSYSQLNMFKEAEEELKKATYLNPKFTEGYHYLGLLYFSQEDYDSAIEQWNKIFEIEPDFSNKYVVLNNLGIVYKKKQMPDKALEYFLQALQLAPEGSPIIEEIEKEIYNIYKGHLDK